MADEEKTRKPDFGSNSLQSGVLERAFDHPLTVYPLALGAAGLGVLFLIDLPSFFLFVAGGSLGFGALSFLANKFLRGEHLLLEHSEALHAMLRDQIKKKMDSLGKQLAEVDSEKGISQLGTLSEKFKNFEDVLARRLNKGELAFSRYLVMAQQVYKGAIDNLEAVGTALQSVSTIDRSALEKRLKALQSHNKKQGEEEEREAKSLLERIALHEEMTSKARRLLTQNEEAMTALDRTAVALANIKIDGQASLDIENAMEELRDLAKRASKYNSQ